MANYCIPASTAKVLIDAIKTGDSIGDIQALYNMTTQERRSAFAKHVGKDTAKLINTEFEKAMVSNQKKALANWAKRTFNAEAKKDGRFDSVIDKINKLDEEGLLTPENADVFLEDLVADRLGITITPKEAQNISEKSRALEDVAREPLSKFGPSVEYFKVKRELDNYIDSLTPTPKLRVATSVIGRATMLFSFKSPLVNIESNTVNAISEALARRIEAGRVAELPVNDQARAYMKYANEVFLKTGYDITRMYTLADGRKRLGEDIVHSQGPGKVRKIGRFYTDIVFNKLMTAPDIAFAAFHFADSANIYATAIAKSEGLKGGALKQKVEEIFIDSTQIEPRTEEGRAVREKARLEAERGTYTNKNNYSDMALMIRKVLNTASGDLRLGDQLMPFVQVPASVVGASIDYSGILLPIDTLVRTKRALNAKSKGDIDAFKSQFDAKYFRKVTRAGIGLTVAFIISTWFEPEDFIGEYPTTEKERELLRLEEASENSIKIGNTWLSMDYFGPLAAPFVGMMSAKKYGTGIWDKMLRYAQGTALQASRIPGVRQLTDITKVAELIDPRRADPEDLKDRAFNYIVDFLRARSLPAIISDLAKGTDKFVRETDKYDAIGRFLMNIPGLRQNLPQKLDLFGEPIEGEGLWRSLFFGSRLKVQADNVLIDEFSRLAQENQLPSITDIRKTSPRAKELRVQIGDGKFREFYEEYGKRFKLDTSRLIESSRYKRADDEGKKKLIEDVKNTWFERMLKKYGYRKPKTDKNGKPITAINEGSSLATIVKEIGNTIGNIIPTVSAEGGEKEIADIEIDGEEVITRYKNGGFKSEHILSDQNVLQAIGGVFASVGEKLKLREFNISEILGYKTKEEQVQAVLDYRNKILGVKVNPEEEAIIKDGYIKAGEGYYKKKENGKYAFIDKDKIPTPVLRRIGEDEKASPALTINVDRIATVTPYDKEIQSTFGDEWTNATRVLRYTDSKGETHGENTGFQVGPEVDIANNDGSIDRGLYRINSYTFKDFMRRKKGTLEKNGIYSYEDMYDPAKNIRMAKIIYDEQGWGAWYASPPDLRTR